jgi:hypothetical protein
VVVRDASAFLWTVLEHAGSPTLRDAAMALYPGGPAVPKPEDMLRHMLRVTVAVLCDAASVRLASEPAPSPVVDTIGSTEIVQSAGRVVAAIEQASWEELADLAFGVTRFMIDCAWEWAGEHMPLPRSRDDKL